MYPGYPERTENNIQDVFYHVELGLAPLRHSQNPKKATLKKYITFLSIHNGISAKVQTT